MSGSLRGTLDTVRDIRKDGLSLSLDIVDDRLVAANHEDTAIRKSEYSISNSC